MIIKKNTLIIVSLCLILVFAAVSVSSVYTFSDNEVKEEKIPKIIIDAGHGGADGGAVGCDGTVEKEINLQIAKKLRSLCLLFGYEVIMTRNDDDSICDKNAKSIRQQKISDIKNRFEIIKNNPDALFVSIHQNIYSSPRYCGAQTFYSKNMESSGILAEYIQKSVTEMIQPENTREIKMSGTEIYLLYHAQSTAVMVECGFMSNPEEMKKLRDNEYQKKMAFSILCGINNYIVDNGI